MLKPSLLIVPLLLVLVLFLLSGEFPSGTICYELSQKISQTVAGPIYEAFCNLASQIVAILGSLSQPLFPAIPLELSCCCEINCIENCYWGSPHDCRRLGRNLCPEANCPAKPPGYYSSIASMVVFGISLYFIYFVMREVSPLSRLTSLSVGLALAYAITVKEVWPFNWIITTLTQIVSCELWGFIKVGVVLVMLAGVIALIEYIYNRREKLGEIGRAAESKIKEVIGKYVS